MILLLDIAAAIAIMILVSIIDCIAIRIGRMGIGAKHPGVTGISQALVVVVGYYAFPPEVIASGNEQNNREQETDGPEHSRGYHGKRGVAGCPIAWRQQSLNP
jgi:hypothetical protein